MPKATRRHVLQAGLVGLGGTALPLASARGQGVAEKPAAVAPVDQRTLGRTGAKVGILGLGLGSQFTGPHVNDPEATEAILSSALSRGCNYFDTARLYGPSEEMIGGFVERNRKDIHLVSKSMDRTYEGMKADIELSLKNLKTDHIDLYFMHNLTPGNAKPDEMATGCHRALLEAREKGLIKSIGISGHTGAAVLMSAIRTLDPDVLLTVLPCTRPDEGRYEDELLPLARDRNMGVVAMKCVRHAREAALKGADLIRYALSLDGVSTAIVGLDQQAHLDQNAEMASTFVAMPADERQAMHSHVTEALAGLPAIWDMPGYQDAVRLA